MKKLLVFGLALGASLALFGLANAQTVLRPGQGGTGIGSATTSNIGQVLAVSSSNPYVFKFVTMASGGGGGGGVNTSTANYFTYYGAATAVTGTPLMQLTTGTITFTSTTVFSNISATSVTTTNLYVSGSNNIVGLGTTGQAPYFSATGTTLTATSGLFFSARGLLIGNVENATGTYMAYGNATAYTPALGLLKNHTLASPNYESELFTQGFYRGGSNVRGVFTNVILPSDATAVPAAVTGNNVDISYEASSTLTTLQGYRSTLRMGNTSSTITNAYAYSAQSNFNSGAMNNFFGYHIPALATTVDPTTSYAFYGGNMGQAGTTNSYGLYLEAQANSTNNYAIYSLGGRSYFAGNVGIASTTPQATLGVEGSLLVNGPATSTNLSITAITSCNASNQALQTDSIGGVSCGTLATGGGGSGAVNTSTANYFTYYLTGTSVTGTPLMQLTAGTVTFTSTTNFAGLSGTSVTTTNLMIFGALKDSSGSKGTTGMVLQNQGGTSTRWVSTSSLSIVPTVGGGENDVQFNVAGGLSGTDAFEFYSSSSTLYVNNLYQTQQDIAGDPTEDMDIHAADGNGVPANLILTAGSGVAGVGADVILTGGLGTSNGYVSVRDPSTGFKARLGAGNLAADTIFSFPTYASVLLGTVGMGTNGYVLQTDGTTASWVSTSSLAFPVGSGGSFTTTSINGAPSTTFKFSTTTDTNLGILITTSTDSINFLPQWIGTLADSRITSAATWNAKLGAEYPPIATSTFVSKSATTSFPNLTQVGTLANLVWTNATGTNVNITGLTNLANTTITNVTSTNLSVSGITGLAGLTFSNATGTNANISGLLSFGNANGTNVTTTNLYISGTLKDNTGSKGAYGQVAMSTGTGWAWVNTSSLGISGGSATPSGTLNSVQFNDGGVFGGTNLLYTGTGYLTVDSDFTLESTGLISLAGTGLNVSGVVEASTFHSSAIGANPAFSVNAFPTYGFGFNLDAATLYTHIKTNGVQRLTISPTGQVSIGTSSVGAARLFIQNGATGDAFHIISSAAVTTSLFVVSNNGRIGISSSTPIDTLAVQGGLQVVGTGVTSTNLSVSGISGLAGLTFTNATGTNANISGLLSFGNANGTSVTTTNLYVSGALNLPNSSVTDAMISSATNWNNWLSYPALATSTFVRQSATTSFPQLATVGTITTGVWNGTLIDILRGGTNSSTVGSAGSVKYSDGTRFQSTAVGTLGHFLMSSGTTAPVWVSSTSLNYLLLTGGTLTGGLTYTTLNGTSITSTNAFFTNVTSTNATTTNLFVSSAATIGTGTTTFQFFSSGHINATGTIPTVSSCGTSPSVVGSDHSGYIQVGSVAATGCTLTFAAPYVALPSCNITNRSMSVVNAMTYVLTTSTIVVSQTALTSAILDYVCWAHE